MNELLIAYHRRNVNQVNAEMLAAGVCVMHAPHRQDPKPDAEYLWCGPKTYGVGNRIPLCAACVVSWLRNAAEDSDLAPERIKVLASGEYVEPAVLLQRLDAPAAGLVADGEQVQPVPAGGLHDQHNGQTVGG